MRNAERFLDQCLAGILDNDSARLEVIVVNDGSKDGSLSIMRTFEHEDARVHVIDKPNGGYGMGVNAGLANAHGAYVAIVEPDDYVRPHFYDETLAYAQTFDRPPDVVKTPYTRVYMPGTPQEHLFHCAYYDRIHPARQPFTLQDAPRLIQHHPSIWSALYKKSFLDEFGIRFLELPGAGWVDNPFLIQTLCHARSIVFYNKEFYCYREDLPGSSSKLMASSLPLERWHQMTDILDELDVHDEGIRATHIFRGFKYLGGIMTEAKISGGPAEGLMCKMFERMESDLVLGSPLLSNANKKLFCQVRGIEGAKWNHLAYFGTLAKEFAYSIRTNGLGFATSRVSVFFARRSQMAENDPTKTAVAGI